MNQQRTRGIILSRVDYGEADRILTVLTPDAGKLGLIAKGVRKVRSKLAGGIELFTVNELTYMPGRGRVHSLLSSRLLVNYPRIITNIDRTMLGYELIKLLNSVTEDKLDQGYFELLQGALAGLNSESLHDELIKVWFWARLLTLGGNKPNLSSDENGNKLLADKTYEFDFERVCMREAITGPFGANEVKFLRILFDREYPLGLETIKGVGELTKACSPIVSSLQMTYLRP